jgi:hypothetical protein
MPPVLFLDLLDAGLAAPAAGEAESGPDGELELEAPATAETAPAAHAGVVPEAPAAGA